MNALKVCIHGLDLGPYCWVSRDCPLTEPGQTDTLALSALWKLCVQKWMIVKLLASFKRDREEGSQCSGP